MKYPNFVNRPIASGGHAGAIGGEVSDLTGKDGTIITARSAAGVKISIGDNGCGFGGGIGGNPLHRDMVLIDGEYYSPAMVKSLIAERDAALAQNAELTRDNASLKSSLTRSYEANDHLNDRHKDLSVMKHARFNNEECWIFDEDNLEENHLESLVCPVVIRAKKLREIFTQNAELVAMIEALKKDIEFSADAIFARIPPDEIHLIACSMLETASKTPVQHLRDRDAEVGRAGFVAGLKWLASYDGDQNVEVGVAADQYAEKVRRGEV